MEGVKTVEANSPEIRNHSINTVRIDAIPQERVKDLDFAKARRALNIRQHGIVRRDYHTIKYTASLYCNIYLKPPFNFHQAFRDVNRIRRILNTCKRTAVTKFKHVIEVNVQGSGNITNFQLSNDNFWNLVDLSSFSNLEFECGTQYTVPTTPISDLKQLVGNLFRFIHVKCGDGNVLRLNRNGSFTIVSRNLDKYYQLLTILLQILQTAKKNSGQQGI